MTAWLNIFESIGDNCEFGFVQRKLGNITGGLLRWALLDSVDATTVGIRNCFDGVFAFENLYPTSDGTMVRDVTAGVAFHTAMRSELRAGTWRFVASEAERRRIHAQELSKFRYQRDKFSQGMSSGGRIYVAKRNEGLTDADAERLLGAIAAHGDGRLLFVSKADALHPPGTVEFLDRRLAQGRVDRFASYSQADNVSLACWETLLRTTASHFADGSRTEAGMWRGVPGVQIKRRKRSRRALPSKEQVAEPGSIPPPGDGPIPPPTECETAPSAFEHAGLTATLTADVTLQSGATVPYEHRHDSLRSDPGAPVLTAPAGLFALAAHGQNARRDQCIQGERSLMLSLPQNGGLKLDLPAAFFDDGYFATAYPNMPRTYAGTKRHDGANSDATGYFSPSMRALATRLQRMIADQHLVLSCAPEQIALLRQIFAPAQYARLLGVPADDPAMLWEHYRVYGLPTGISPTPLFDPQLYLEQVRAKGLPSPDLGEPLALHWLRLGIDAGLVPNGLFDEAFYLAANTDVFASGTSAFKHYLSTGIYEGRAPTPWFDQAWYQSQGKADRSERYDHFITIGMHEGRMPSALVDRIMHAFGRGVPFTAKIYAALVEVSLMWQGRVAPEAIRLLVSMYSPQWHVAASSPLEGFLDYLHQGVPLGRCPGPLFDDAVYRQRAAAAGLPGLEPSGSAVEHWLCYGQAARIVPTERFNEAFYRANNPDIARMELWGFAHFVCYGAFEGRLATATPMFRRREALPGTDDGAMPSIYRYWHTMDFPDNRSRASDEIPAAAYRRLEEVLQSDLLAEIFTQAQAIDPVVGDIASINDFLLLPFYDGMALRNAEVRRRLPEMHYDTVICVPWIRVGGADLVAGLLAKSLLRVRPHERVLVLRTDQPHFERAHWLPAAVDVVDISDLTMGLPQNHTEDLLRVVLRGVTARRVFNVNSRLCWTALCTHGSNLAATLRVYAYLFCWDQTPTGLRAGYPSEFYVRTAGHVTAFMTDTNYLRDELTKIYRIPPMMRDRIVPMFTPAQTALHTPSIARVVQERAAPASRNLVLWAGRLDRQKRFDLVQAIARLMPDVEFRCWGAALLDTPPDLDNLPDNISMQGSFDSFDDLPLREAGAWLFTAAWEGMPTTIIELAARGVAIVASAVGGVPELIQPDTGWPVPAEATAEGYADILRDALSSPQEATRKAEALQRRVAATYNEQTYDAAMERLLAREDGT